MEKKFAATLLFVCLLINSFAIIPTFAISSFKEGVYQLTNLNVTPKNRYTIQNVSPDNSAYVALFDEDQRQIQSIHLSPKSGNYSLIPLEPSYRIVIIGKGEVIIA